ncbi:hypothetical protein P8452_31075 [Trifolium repens]|nr:hypothetical protein P8452_31075 [Trifolium repens]
MEAPMEFWGAEVKVGQSVKVDPDDEQYEGYIHISQVALGEVKKGKATEPVVVYVKVDDQKLVLGTLIKDEIPQISLDIVLEKEAELSHNSKNAAVYFSGYKVFRGMDEDDEDADLSDSDGELAPMRERVEAAKELAKSGKPAGAVAKQVKIIDPTSGKTVDPEEIKDLSGDESDSDFSEEFNSDSEDGESEEEGLMVDQGKKNKGTNENAPKAPVPTKKAKIATPEKTDSDVDSSDEDISDEDISDEDISDDDSSDEETPVQKGKNNKRPNEAGPQTPVSAKKAKNATPGKSGDGKKGVHIATPHPMKKAGKTPQNVAKNQSPSSNKPKKSNQGRR